MTVLDTNVVSEVMRKKANANVLDWLDAQPPDALLLTAITAAEILQGIDRLPDGKRKSALRDAAVATFKKDFAGRMLAFDEEAAEFYARLVSTRERMGRPIGMADALIASICLSYGAALATRNVHDFDAIGLTVLNPWEAKPMDDPRDSDAE